MKPSQVQFKIILFKGKIVDDDKFPLMLQVKTGKAKYQRISLGFSAFPNSWISKAETFSGNEYLPLNQKLFESKTKARQILEELDMHYEKNNVPFSFDVFKRKFLDLDKEETETIGNDIPRTFFTFLDWYIEELTALDKIGDRLNFKTLKSVGSGYIKQDILLDSINKMWLEKFKSNLHKRKNRKGEPVANVTVWTYLKTMRTLMSKARYYEVTSNNPFRNSSNPNGFAFHQLEKAPRISRSMSDDELNRFLDFDFENTTKRKSLAYLICYLIYLFRGIPISDIALLTQENISNNEISFGRVKTHKKVPNIPLDERRMKVINLLKQYTDGFYLVPILNKDRHKTKQQKYNRIEKIKSFVNKSLKEIAIDQGIKINLTTYTFRHTYSRKVLEKHGVWKLKEALGHESILTTQKYAGSLSDKEVAKTDDVFDDIY